MPLLHQKKLKSIQEKIKTLQEEHLKTEQALGNSLLKALKGKNALSLDMNTLVGGIFSVVDRINTAGKADKECESWQKVGQKYFNKKHK